MKNGNLKLNTSQDFTGWVSRVAKVLPKTFTKKGDSVVVEAVITTEAPAIVVDWERWEMVREILLMSGVVLPDTKQVTLLNTHSRYSTEDIRGSIRELRVEGDALVGDVHFWSKAEDDISLVKEGHLTDLSAGYKTFEEHTIEVGKGAQAEVNGGLIKNDFEDGLRMLIRTKWELKEGSLVPIGADKAAKFRSGLQINPSLFDNTGKGIKTEDPQLQEKIDKAFKEVNNEIDKLKSENKQLIITINKRNDVMPDKNNQDLTPEKIRKAERERVAGIEGIAAFNVSQKLYKGGPDGLAKITRDAIVNDWSVDKFRNEVWKDLKDEDIVDTPVTDLDLTKKQRGKLSISRAIDSMLMAHKGVPDAWDKNNAGLEQEVMLEAGKRADAIPGFKSNGGLILAQDFFMNPDVRRHSVILNRKFGNEQFGERVDVSGAGNLIATEHWAAEFIDVLRNLGVAGPWGVRMISGQKGNPTVPKKTSTGTFSWVAESGTGTATDFVIGQLTATPKNGWSSMKYTRQAALQGEPALDALILDDILMNVITGRDKALLHGTGAGNEPGGIAVASGVGDVVGASLDWDAIVEFWTDVKTNNVDSSTMKFVMNALTAGTLMTRPVVSAGYLGFLMDNLKKISQNPIISEQANAGYLFYGDGSEAWVIDWGTTELLVNPYKDDTGDVVITAFTAMDIIIARVKAFSVSDDVT